MATNLFIKFTSQIWLTLHHYWRQEKPEIPPGTLLEAMDAWSVDSICYQLVNVTIVPCNAGLAGSIPEPKALSFLQRKSIFFLAQGESELNHLWNVLTNALRFIRTYWDYCSKLPNLEHDELDALLEKIFSCCQCLPTTQQAGSQHVLEVHDGRVLLFGNPCQYHIQRIGSKSDNWKSRQAPTHCNRSGLVAAWAWFDTS